MQNASREHSAILSTFIKLSFAFKTFVLSFFEWPVKTGLTVCSIVDIGPAKFVQIMIKSDMQFYGENLETIDFRSNRKNLKSVIPNCF